MGRKIWLASATQIRKQLGRCITHKLWKWFAKLFGLHLIKYSTKTMNVSQTETLRSFSMQRLQHLSKEFGQEIFYHCVTSPFLLTTLRVWEVRTQIIDFLKLKFSPILAWCMTSIAQQSRVSVVDFVLHNLPHIFNSLELYLP